MICSPRMPFFSQMRPYALANDSEAPSRINFLNFVLCSAAPPSIVQTTVLHITSHTHRKAEIARDRRGVSIKCLISIHGYDSTGAAAAPAGNQGAQRGCTNIAGCGRSAAGCRRSARKALLKVKRRSSSIGESQIRRRADSACEAGSFTRCRRAASAARPAPP